MNNNEKNITSEELKIQKKVAKSIKTSLEINRKRSLDTAHKEISKILQQNPEIKTEIDKTIANNQ